MKSTSMNKAAICCTVLCAAVVSGLPLLGLELEDAVAASMAQAGDVSIRDKEFMANAMKVLWWGTTAIQSQWVRSNQTTGVYNPMNQFTHSGPADPSDASIVSPNVDVVYNTAWLNLADGPVQLNIPDTEGRFFIAECIHYYQGVFAAPGYTNGETGKQTVVFHHGDEVPSVAPGISVIRSPTPIMWIVLRVKWNGPDDTEAAQECAEGFTLQTYGKTPEPTPIPTFHHRGSPWVEPAGSNPHDYVGSGLYPWVTISDVWQENKPWRSDRPYSFDGYKIGGVINEDVIEASQKVGFDVDGVFNPKRLTKKQRNILGQVAEMWNNWLRVYFKYEQRLSIMINPQNYTSSIFINPCTTFTNNNRGYLIRDIVAIAYIAANCARDAVYFKGDKSTDGKPLNAKHNRMYTVTIPGNMPVKSTGYWSLTMYNSSNFMLVENSEEIYHYNIQNATPDEDGNYPVVMSYKQPVKPPYNAEPWNWLPAPDGLFYAVTRVYAPESVVSSGLYYPPGIEKVE